MAWQEDETLCLIALWSEDSIQAQIEGCKRNKEVYEKLAAQMQEEGYRRTGQQCREKIKKLKGDYRKIKDNNNETGRARRSTRIFEALDRILGHKPATHPPIVLDTLSDRQEELDPEPEVGEIEASNLDSTDLNCDETLPTENLDSTPNTVTPTTRRNKGLKRDQEGQIKSRRREAQMKDMFETAMVGIREMKNADTLLVIELEEKRMKYEDSRLREEREYEERRRREEREFENTRRKEERAFQLQMMQLLAGFGQQPPQFGSLWSYTNLLEDNGSLGSSQQNQ